MVLLLFQGKGGKGHGNHQGSIAGARQNIKSLGADRPPTRKPSHMGHGGLAPGETLIVQEWITEKQMGMSCPASWLAAPSVSEPMVPLLEQYLQQVLWFCKSVQGPIYVEGPCLCDGPS